MIDFPASPTLGQQFTAAGVTWTWDGAKWTASGLSVAYVPLAGFVPAMNDNRIINGDMRIDQRNNGASGTATGYTVDRWLFQASLATKGAWQRSVNSPMPSAGFPNGLMFTSNSAYTPLTADYFIFAQKIEADMISDFAWGTANAQLVTLSFWAYSNQTGAFGGSIRDAANTRSYPFSFSIPAASTWTKIVITIPGDTAGAWVMNGNAASVMVNFDLGAGATFRGPANAWASANYVGVTGSASIVATNAANFVLTGVKLEIGSVATPYNRQSLAKSMADCQRYYQIYTSLNASGYNAASGVAYGNYVLPAMRAAPTVVFSNQSYLNASAMAMGTVDVASLRTQITVTAAGFGSGNATVALSAEL